MRRFAVVAVFVLAAALHIRAQGPPPFPCGSAIILPSDVAFKLQGSISGCTEQGGTCIAGETIVFTAVTTNHCIMSDFWQFPGDPVAAGAAINHVFASTGSFTVTMTAVGPNNSVQVSKTVVVAASSAIPALGPSMIVLLLAATTLVAMRRLR
jgi:PKD domain-containing protein